MKTAHSYNTNAWFARAGRFMRKAHPIKFTLILTAVLMVLLTILGLPEEFGLIKDIEYATPPISALNENPVFTIIMAVIYAPLIETLLFQMLPWFILSKSKLVRRHRIIAVVASALIFGVLHYYSVFYMIATFMIGMVFMWAYIVKNGKNPYWNVVLLHAVWNALAIAGHLLLENKL